MPGICVKQDAVDLREATCEEAVGGSSTSVCIFDLLGSAAPQIVSGENAARRRLLPPATNAGERHSGTGKGMTGHDRLKPVLLGVQGSCRTGLGQCQQSAVFAGTAEVASRGFFAPAPCGNADLKRAKTLMLLKLPPILAPQINRALVEQAVYQSPSTCRRVASRLPALVRSSKRS